MNTLSIYMPRMHIMNNSFINVNVESNHWNNTIQLMNKTVVVYISVYTIANTYI